MKFSLKHGTVLGIVGAFGLLLTAISKQDGTAVAASLTAVFLAFMPAVQELFGKPAS